MNPVVIAVRDCQAYLRDAIESVLAQDIPVRVLCVNNGSTDGATQRLAGYRSDQVATVAYYPQHGVAHAWNRGLEWAWAEGAEHALVINSDVILRTDTYRLLLADGGGFVTAVGVRGREFIRDGKFCAVDEQGQEVFPGQPVTGATRPHPDFSCYLIRRAIWDAVGPFDEHFKGAYAEDWDYHVRLHQAGVPAHCIDAPFYHRGAGVAATAVGDERSGIHERAEANRRYFRQKWGVTGGSPEYYGLFGHEPPPAAPPTLDDARGSTYTEIKQG